MAVKSKEDGNGWEVYRRLLGYTLQHKRRLVIATIGLVMYGVSATGLAAVIRPLIDGSFVERDVAVIRWSLAALIVVFLVRSASSYASSYSLKWVARRAITDIRAQMFDQLLVLPIRFFDKSASGELMSKMIFNVEQIAAAASNAFTTFVRESVTVIGLFAWMLYLDWHLSLVFVVMGPLIGLVVRLVSDKLRNASRNIQSSMGNVSEALQQVIDAREEVRAFVGHASERRRFNARNELNRRQSMKLVAINEASIPIIEFIVVLTLVGVVFFITLAKSGEPYTAGTFISFVGAMALMISPMKKLATVNVQIQRGIAAGESIFAFLDEPPEIDTGRTVLPEIEGHVRFSGVSHRYADDLDWVLRDIDLELHPGQMVALVGRSGSGKSTLVKLLPRFYDASSGRIEIDGHDVRDLTLASLRGHIALVGQYVTLFNATVRENLSYGLNREVSDEELREVARSAHALEFIEKLPGGFSAQIGEDGVLLSGGQRQRLAIARAILKEAPILILDEATASLDSESERHIQAALDTLMRDRTSLVIAHRLSTIEHADNILVVDQGRIVEQGRHQELIKADGIYAELHRVQFRTQPKEAGPPTV